VSDRVLFVISNHYPTECNIDTQSIG